MSYEPGALGGLLGAAEGGQQASLFTHDKKQKEPERNQAVLKTKPKTKRSPSEKEEAVNASPISKRPRPSLKSDTTDFDADTASYTRPSLKAQVRAEDSKKRVLDLDKDDRTVFVGNLPIAATKKGVQKLFTQYGAIETVRFRGVARPDMKTTKRVAAITRTTHENRHNINAYVRFKEKKDAERACQANGTSFQDHVLRVDLTKADNTHDQSKAVFLGNLALALEENAVYSHFSACGEIVGVRLVRDSITGIGKGIGYVNFREIDGVSEALKLNGSDLAGRSIRVARCVRKPKAVVKVDAKRGAKAPRAAASVRKMSRKKIRDNKKIEFRGHAVGEQHTKAKKKRNKGEQRKKALSRKLIAQK